MSIKYFEDAKILKAEFARLGRDGICERAIQLIGDCDVEDYHSVLHLVGRFKALAMACHADSYWHEVYMRGFAKEMYELRKYQKPELQQQEPNHG